MRYRNTLLSLLLAQAISRSEYFILPGCLSRTKFSFTDSKSLRNQKHNFSRLWGPCLVSGNASGAHGAISVLVTTIHIRGLECLLSHCEARLTLKPIMLWWDPTYKSRHHSFKAKSSLPASFFPLIGWPLLCSIGLWFRKRSGFFPSCSFQLTFWCTWAQVYCPSSAGDAQHAIQLGGAQGAKWFSWEGTWHDC